MSVCAPKGVYGTPVDKAMVRSAAKVAVTVGSQVKYIGRGQQAYWGKTMVVTAITERPFTSHTTTLFLRRPNTHPSHGYVVTAQPSEVLAL